MSMGNKFSHYSASFIDGIIKNNSKINSKRNIYKWKEAVI